MKVMTEHFRAGINARAHGNLTEAAQQFIRGHEQADAECTAQLAICYREGTGVARDDAEYYRLADALQREHCPLAYCLLATAYACGMGCTASKEKAVNYLKRWAKESAEPLPGISEECRLHMRAFGLGHALEAQLEHLSTGGELILYPELSCREYAERSPLDDWRKAQVRSLPHDADKKWRELGLLRRAVDDGLDGAACMLGLRLLQHADEAEKADARTRQAALDFIAKESGCSDYAELLLIKWLTLPAPEGEGENPWYPRLLRSMQYGPSGIPRKNELSCSLLPQQGDFSSLFHIRSREDTERYIRSEQWNELYEVTTLPHILITNTGSATLSGLKVRIIHEGLGQEITSPVKADLAPGDSEKIDLNHLTPADAQDIRVEVHAPDGRYTAVSFPGFFIQQLSISFPQVQIFHEKHHLVIIPKAEDIRSLQLLTPAGEKIAEFSTLRQHKAVHMDIWHLKAALLEAREDRFLLQAPNCHPAVCLLQ